MKIKEATVHDVQVIVEVVQSSYKFSIFPLTYKQAGLSSISLKLIGYFLSLQLLFNFKARLLKTSQMTSIVDKMLVFYKNI